MHHSFIHSACQARCQLWDIAVSRTDKALVPMKFIYWVRIGKALLSPGFPHYTLGSLLSLIIFRG